MKKYAFIWLWLVMQVSYAQVPNITAMEYYLDVDPGFGNGTAISISAGPTQDLDFSVPTGALSPGFHTLYVRALDANGTWSHFESQPFFVALSTTESRNNITALEYYFDTDPGQGSGTPVAVTASTDLNINELIPTASLSSGFHTIYFRVQDAAGVWSMPESQPFFISLSTTEVINNINLVEYFFDQDPGFGNGIQLPQTPATNLDFDQMIDVSSLSSGFHSIYFRVRDEAGQWSATESEPFFISVSTTQTINNINLVEYFFDTDPGFGNGIQLPQTPSTNVDFDEMVDVSSLSSGFHTIYFRVRDEAGQWSATESEPFFISVSTTQTINNINLVEYFFDTDPGFGNGIQLPQTPSTNVDFDEMVDVSSLSSGFHSIYFRVRDEAGQWSATESEPFFISVSTTQSTNNIDLVEYFFNTDPGFGNGIQLPQTPASNVDLIEMIDVSALPTGFHTIYVRVRDEAGQWSATENQPFFITSSSTQSATTITAMEYYFDVDPGFGNGQSLSITPGMTLDENVVVPITGVPAGMHTIYVRALDDRGQWSHFESAPFFKDQLRLIEEMEFFIDMGDSTSVAITPPENIITEMITIPTDTLVPGIPGNDYTFNIRVRNGEGAWSITEDSDFTLIGYSLLVDSVALDTLFRQTVGMNWTDSTNWYKVDLDTWFGVDTLNNRVQNVQLSDNLLNGPLPREIGYLNAAETIDLSNNQLAGAVPDLATNLTALTTLDLTGNDLDHLPDLSSLTSLSTFKVSGNRFTFEDLEPNAGIITENTDQQPFGSPQTYILNEGDAQTLSFTVGGANNVYQWELNGVDIPGANSDSYDITSFSTPDLGIYKLKVTNTVVTGITLESEPVNITVDGVVEGDSLALVAIYNALDGINWSNNSNWVTPAQEVETWFGVVTTDGRVTALSLPGNQLTGDLPNDILVLTALTDIDLSGNSIATIPGLASLTNLTNINVSDNLLQFGSLEANAALPGIVYAPQKVALQEIDNLGEVNEEITIDGTLSGTSNAYVWFKDSVAIAGETDPTLVFASAQFVNEGIYYAQVTNALVPGLTITTANYILKISSLARDRIALTNIYNATGGPEWTNNTDWLSDDLSQWFGVTVANNRVTELILPKNNMQGNMPTDLRDIGQIVTIRLDSNELRQLPDVTRLKQLTTLEVTGNRLGFGDLVPNRTIANFGYNPQRRFGVTLNERVPVGDDFQVAIEISGEDNKYQWFRKPRRTAEDVPGDTVRMGTNSTYTIEDINLNNMGIYYVEVRNDLLPDLVIRNRNQNVFAITDIFGTVFLNKPAGVVMDDGDVLIYEILELGQPFELISSSELGPTGAYGLEDVILGDFIIIGRPGPTYIDDVLQTYYISANDWLLADSLFLAQQQTGIDINMIPDPPPFDPALGDGTILGIVESDFPDPVDPEEGLREEARRRVRRAGVSLNRLVTRRGGRTQQDVLELVAYTETDENGEFSFEDVPPGDYFINIQIPGVPMDTTNLIQITIEENKTNQVFSLEALALPDAIRLALIEETGFYKKYFDHLEIYPNPARDYLNINFERRKKGRALEARLIDLTGTIVGEWRLDNVSVDQMQLDLTRFRRGVYLLNIVDLNKRNLPVANFRVLLE